MHINGISVVLCYCGGGGSGSVGSGGVVLIMYGVCLPAEVRRRYQTP